MQSVVTFPENMCATSIITCSKIVNRFDLYKEGKI